ncbi:hypothetical protein [Streptomyces sp. NBC_00503]|uniref:hypothetical protein n=1 Tax=Streptomyces sp. NBC_00503 TaxID=2903659 RepID=UPI002E81B6B4|nr:hypothetical protein [Streptomyces sp. NBC_00503]WUD80163.1 hypothetical protein OG490_06100 [Streptomyces sp. NBC_00503]
MGTDIHGFVECVDGEGEPWVAAIDISLLYHGRNYDAFGCLFGMRNFAGFRPLAEDRGIPEDASEGVRAEFAEWRYDGHSATWIGWAELKRVDWSEPAEQVDARIHQYRRTPDGWVMSGKSAWDGRVAEVTGLSIERDPGRLFRYEAHDWPEGTEWPDGDDLLYRVGRLTRRDAVALDGEWKPLWTVMETLAGLYGDENVRLTVWFDN